MEAIQETLYWLSSTIAQTVAIGFGVLAFFIQTALRSHAEAVKENFKEAEQIKYPRRQALRKSLRHIASYINDCHVMAIDEADEQKNPDAEIISLKDRICEVSEWIEELQEHAQKPEEPEEFLEKWDKGVNEQTIERIGQHLGRVNCTNLCTQYRLLKRKVDDLGPDWDYYVGLKTATRRTAYISGSTILFALAVLSTISWLGDGYYPIPILAYVIVSMGGLLALAYWCIKKFAGLVVESLNHLP